MFRKGAVHHGLNFLIGRQAELRVGLLSFLLDFV
jgi:hypothetical protein